MTQWFNKGSHIIQILFHSPHWHNPQENDQNVDTGLSHLPGGLWWLIPFSPGYARGMEKRSVLPSLEDPARSMITCTLPTGSRSICRQRSHRNEMRLTRKQNIHFKIRKKEIHSHWCYRGDRRGEVGWHFQHHLLFSPLFVCSRNRRHLKLLLMRLHFRGAAHVKNAIIPIHLHLARAGGRKSLCLMDERGAPDGVNVHQRDREHCLSQ